MHTSLRLSGPASLLAATALFSGLSTATQPPTYPGYTILWHDDFVGPAGSAPDPGRWHTVTGYLNVNGEAEVYSASNSNLQLSGGDTVQLVPQKDPSSSGAGAGWTSARIETQAGFTPRAGGITRVEGSIRTGSNPASQEQGIWPAFWLLGESIRTGTKWPDCGELDILEQRNGVATGYGTAHCGDSSTGGICNEPGGLGGTVPIPAEPGRSSRIKRGPSANATASANDGTFHVWTITWDLTSNNWQSETITWALDGRRYFSLSGQRINNQAVWNSLAHNSLNIILNVAVGGGFPGAPNLATRGSYGSMMEVQYVAVYSS
ncbi:hypothetical protein SCUCBS95973_002684 [Sporothrix curviconia]|uniref:GH16 domain-containing protein n=1 Tax=Sporothrix curviconia TaxID=1260050 RepID=A0ABP0B983_9PEZI